MMATTADALRRNPTDTNSVPNSHRIPRPPPPPKKESTDNNDKSSLHAAAQLIQTLDTAFVEMNTLAASSARDADEARKNARAASEVARRFAKKSFPTDMMNPSFDMLLTTPEEKKMTTTTASAVNGEPPLATPGSLGIKTSEKEPSTAGWKRKTYNARSPSSSVERLAESHAEDVLSLSLELERAKQAHEAEKKAHEETRSTLAQTKQKNSHLEQQIQKLLNDMETERESHGRQNDSLKKELERAKLRVEAAEEDAQLALDLAKGNAESREQCETWLQRALTEVQVLREQIVPYAASGKETGTAATPTSGTRSPQTPQSPMPPQTPKPPQTPQAQPTPPSSGKRSVRFASSPVILSESTRQEEKQQQKEREKEKEKEKEAQIQLKKSQDQLIETPNKETQLTTPSSTSSRPSRTLVAAGRNVLQRSLAKRDDVSEHSFEYTPERSAERRRRFKEHIRKSNDSIVAASPSSVVRSPRTPRSPYSPGSTRSTSSALVISQPNFNSAAITVCRSAIKLLQASAKRLGLGGHWWRDGARADPNEEYQVDSLETLTRNYCQSVEVKIEHQKTQINELESLCAFLEERLENFD